MHSVYFPVHVVLVLRRLVNVISSLSISNQYLLLKQAKADEERVRNAGWPTPIGLAGEIAQTIPKVQLDEAASAEWPWWVFRDKWGWPRLLVLDGLGKVVESRHQVSLVGNEEDAENRLSLPWIGRNWTWPSLLSTTARTKTNPDPHGGPPFPTRRSSDSREDGHRSETNPKTPPQEPGPEPAPLDTIHQLMRNPVLYDPLRTPRYPIVLCHGLYGFDSRGPLTFPSMRMHYWSNVLNVLRDTVRAEVIVTSVPGTGSISSRSETLDQQLQHKARGRGVNFLAHSMGGLDCRHLISHIKPSEYAPLSLTTISTPHRGSPFMDWCAENIGIGKLGQHERDLSRSINYPNNNANLNASTNTNPDAGKTPIPKAETSFSLSFSSLPSSFTTLLLSIVDSPAYANLTSTYLNDVFNPRTPDDPTVKYFSVAGRMPGASVWHPFWLPKLVLDGVEEKERARLKAASEVANGGLIDESPLWAQEREWGNDGLVTVQSAKWGEFLGIMEGCDHWEMRGARGIEFGVDLPAIPALGLGVSTSGHRSANGDSWGLRDWTRFVSAWNRQEKIEQAAAVKATGEPRADVTPEGRAWEQARQKDRDDAILKSSTDKLSAVFDWLTDQVPPSPLLSTKTKVVVGKVKPSEDGATNSNGQISEMQKHMNKEGKARKKNELATKLDLERFYVALSKKIYDEGL